MNLRSAVLTACLMGLGASLVGAEDRAAVVQRATTMVTDGKSELSRKDLDPAILQDPEFQTCRRAFKQEVEALEDALSRKYFIFLPVHIEQVLAARSRMVEKYAQLQVKRVANGEKKKRVDGEVGMSEEQRAAAQAKEREERRRLAQQKARERQRLVEARRKEAEQKAPVASVREAGTTPVVTSDERRCSCAVHLLTVHDSGTCPTAEGEASADGLQTRDEVVQESSSSSPPRSATTENSSKESPDARNVEEGYGGSYRFAPGDSYAKVAAKIRADLIARNQRLPESQRKPVTPILGKDGILERLVAHNNVGKEVRDPYFHKLPVGHEIQIPTEYPNPAAMSSRPGISRSAGDPARG